MVILILVCVCSKAASVFVFLAKTLTVFDFVFTAQASINFQHTLSKDSNEKSIVELNSSNNVALLAIRFSLITKPRPIILVL